MTHAYTFILFTLQLVYQHGRMCHSQGPDPQNHKQCGQIEGLCADVCTVDSGRERRARLKSLPVFPLWAFEPEGRKKEGSIRLQGSNCHAQSATSPHSRREPSASQPFPERAQRLARLAAELCQAAAPTLEEESKYCPFSLRAPTKGWLQCGLPAGDQTPLWEGG